MSTDFEDSGEKKTNLQFKRMSYMEEASFTAVPLSFPNCPYSPRLLSCSLSTIPTIPPLSWELPFYTYSPVHTVTLSIAT